MTPTLKATSKARNVKNTVLDMDMLTDGTSVSQFTVLLIRNGPLVHKYYINRVSLSQDYIP